MEEDRASSSESIRNHEYGIVANIPACFHSADLRNYFSQFIEARGFSCFHFRHRPEKKVLNNADSISTLLATTGPAKPSADIAGKDRTLEHDDDGQRENIDVRTAGTRSAPRSKPADPSNTFCCVVRLERTMMNKFIRMYHKKPWIDKSGSLMSRRCFISRIQVENQQTGEEKEYTTRAESRLIPPDRETFTESDLNKLAELNPPDLMPGGNVGTPTAVFLEYIRACRLPPRLIQKLGLSFSKSRTNRRYGNVPFAYMGGSVVQGLSEREEIAVTASGHEIVDEVTAIRGDSEQSNGSGNARNGQSAERKSKSGTEEGKQDSESDGDDDDDTCEEWERHESLHDDVTSQGRTKERLFEEKIELKWEKGGSGLVFYTDAAFWDAQEGDFDEKTSDDWDVDMSIYYDEHGGDKDAKDFIAMRKMERMKKGLEADTSVFGGSEEPIGKFEKHTKGIGRRVLERQGWADGEGLGRSSEGMADALDNTGQHTRDKTGFGFHGEKLQVQKGSGGKSRRKRQRVTEEDGIVITTIYDDPREADPPEPLMRSRGPHHLKYRHEIEFVKGDRR